MSTKRLWILGASDPEMAAIERLLTDTGEEIAYATVDGVQVHPGNAYMADAPVYRDPPRLLPDVAAEPEGWYLGDWAAGEAEYLGEVLPEILLVECGGDDWPEHTQSATPAQIRAFLT